MAKLVDVAQLHKQCSYPIYLETDGTKPVHEHIANRGGHAASDNCNAAADTAVGDDRLYRCPTHRGQVRPGVKGEVHYKVERA